MTETTYKTKTENGMTHYWCEEDQIYYPEYTTDEQTKLSYKLDPTNFLYFPMLEYTTDPEEKKLLEEPIDRWGRAWQKFVKEQYPTDVTVLQLQCRWAIIPRLIDREAWEMYDRLEKQYTAENPRPKDFMECARWEKMKSLEIDGTIMREIALQRRE
ncbi:MAG: hypothetical protein LBU36_00435 [Clostridiales bacterium]|nr:hypothetical protein [Clostridiales bacterium]